MLITLFKKYISTNYWQLDSNHFPPTVFPVKHYHVEVGLCYSNSVDVAVCAIGAVVRLCWLMAVSHLELIALSVVIYCYFIICYIYHRVSWCERCYV